MILLKTRHMVVFFVYSFNLIMQFVVSFTVHMLSLTDIRADKTIYTTWKLHVHVCWLCIQFENLLHRRINKQCEDSAYYAQKGCKAEI